jgi:glutamate carboxypeptidase
MVTMSGARGGKDLLEWTRARTPEMLALLRDLVSIETPSDDPASIEELALRLLPEFRAVGLEPELVPVAGAGPLLRATAPGKPLLLGHLDTVWPRGTLARRPPRLEGGRFFAPGAFDMKAGLVIALYALKASAAAGGRATAALLLTPLEEVGGDAYRPLMEDLMRSASAVLCFEPAWPGGAVKTARKGSLGLLLEAFGRSAHAGADFERGANAVLEIAEKALEAAALTDPTCGITVNVGVLRGGTRPNVIPDRACAEIDVRFPKRDDGERLEAQLRSFRSSRPGTRLEMRVVSRYPPLERTPQVAALFEEARKTASALGLSLDEVSTGGASEASFAAALGIPTLDGLGADGDGAHAEDEHVLLASLPERAALAASLLDRLEAPRT